MSKLKGLFFIIWFTLYGLFAVAQTATIKGKITGSNGHELVAATIAIPKLHKGAVSDSAGLFQIDRVPFGTWQLEVSSLGCRPYKINISVDKEEIQHDVVLTISTENSLNEVVVSGTMKEVSKLESPVPVEVYTAKFFKANPVACIFDALQT